MQRQTRRVVTSAVVLALFVSAARAQTASLVADLTTRGEDQFDRTPSPQNLLRFRDRIVFGGLQQNGDAEPWVTDGTATGTEMLADTSVSPLGFRFLGPVGGALLIAAEQPSALWRTDGTRAGTVRVTEPDAPRLGHAFAVTAEGVFFAGHTPELGSEPWISDGTPAGTRLLRDVVPGADGSEPREAIVFDDKVFFVTGPLTQPELWVSDGSAAGTRRVMALPGSYAYLLTAAGDRFFFLLRGESARELWASDGSPAGTRMVAHPEPSSSFEARWLKTIDGQLYFVSRGPGIGVDHQVWRSDGTAGGTRPVAPVLAALQYATLLTDPSQLQVVNGKILFVAAHAASYELVPQVLWATNGDPASTEVLTFACLAGCGDGFLVTTNLLVSGGWAYFAADDGVHGREPWRSDGTAAGTALVADVCPGPCDGVASSAPAFLEQAGRVLFVGKDGSGQREVWRTDGTAAGTRPWSDLPPGVSARAFRFEVAPLGDELFFAAGRSQSGDEGLWASDGTPGGTRVLSEPHRGTPRSFLYDLTAAGTRILFRSADEEDGIAVWQSEGTAATTREVRPPIPFPDEDCPDGGCPIYPGTMAGAGGLGFFHELEDDSLPRLWRTDGTPAGTFPVTPVTVATSAFLVTLGDAVFFPVATVDGSGYRPELWRSDGTLAGTHKVFDLPEHGAPVHTVDPLNLTAAGDALYFVQHQSGGVALWTSDGSAPPVRVVPGLVSVPPIGPQFTAAGPSVYFTLSDGASGYELWRTEASGAVRVQGFPSLPMGLHEVAGGLSFIVYAGGGFGVWWSDGTAAGTTLVGGLPFVFANLPLMAAAGDRVFFLGQEAEEFALWVSDGTPGGTRRLKVFPAGPFRYQPQWLTGAAGRVFFDAHDPVHGVELWVSDGSEAGTRMLQDLAPGAAPSSPAWLTLAGNRLFFVADDGVFGRELWAIDFAQPEGVCTGSDTALCLGGRFRVEAAWKDFAANTGRGHTIPLTADTGAFWFFGPDNVEVVLKVLDGRTLNDHHWVFYGALSSVEYALTVTDAQTGLTSRYWNPSGELASVADTSGFGPLGAFSVVERSTASGAAPRVRASTDPAAAAAGTCTPSPTRLCLRGGRFAVEAAWKDFAGNTGVGSAVSLTADTGWFWFFGPTNVEVMLKVLDGTPLNGKHWVFYGALSSVEYTLRVTDTATGAVRTYTNPSGNLASVADTGAF